jgi:hypothetical protein
MEFPIAQVLLENYSVLAMEYFGAADDLANLVGSHDEFEVAQRYAQLVYAKCREALSALEKHRLEHGCNIAM